MLILAIFLFLLAIFLFWRSKRQQQASGLPGGRIIYVDTRAWGNVEEPLYDPALNLTGKPDYIIQKGSTIIPVEVKSTNVSGGPYDGHIYQLAAYCFLVEKHTGKRPPYGILNYTNRTYSIEYTSELESTLLDILAEMRIQERRAQVYRSHDIYSRCAKCGFNSICDQRL
jgi:CRISPR-associated exonuclease Cas4